MMFSSEQAFVINGDNNEALSKVLQLALDLSGTKEIEAFYEDPNGLVLCRHGCKGAIKYPFKATIPILVEQINQYTHRFSGEALDYLAGRKPDVDGTVRIGWVVFCPTYDGLYQLREYNYWDAVVAVRPCWIVYDK